MDAPPPPTTTTTLTHNPSMSQTSEQSHTASDYIASQLRLEADAREALPYQFDTCTKPLGPLRQSVFACLTCTPPPASKYQQFTPAGVCYSCSISCHGEHNLVELFTKRHFECDCGSTRMGNSGTTCSLRINEQTGLKGGVQGEKAREGNRYNQNYEGTFCGCGDEYDPELERGTMFQCLGLGTVEEGGCGEDWWHPECLMGLPRRTDVPVAKSETTGGLETVKEETDAAVNKGETNGETDGEAEHEKSEEALPPGFPAEDDFDHLICYKCVEAFPWIKQYAGTPGFLPAVSAEPSKQISNGTTSGAAVDQNDTVDSANKKRKADDEAEGSQGIKKVKADTESVVPIAPAAEALEHNSAAHTSNGTITPAAEPANNGCTSASATEPARPHHSTLPPPPSGLVTLFLREDFRDHLCRCAECFPRLAKHSQLLEEEISYEPPLSESDAGGNDAHSTAGSGSIYERGEAALSSMDRVKAIEGVMAYNHVRDKVKDFLKPFAESGQAVDAESIKAYFAKLRGDEAAVREQQSGY